MEHAGAFAAISLRDVIIHFYPHKTEGDTNYVLHHVVRLHYKKMNHKSQQAISSVTA
jgi:hypothetical protein